MAVFHVSKIITCFGHSEFYKEKFVNEMEFNSKLKVPNVTHV
jgi:hypothetical protein